MPGSGARPRVPAPRPLSPGTHPATLLLGALFFPDSERSLWQHLSAFSPPGLCVEQMKEALCPVPVNGKKEEEKGRRETGGGLDRHGDPPPPPRPWKGLWRG